MMGSLDRIEVNGLVWSPDKSMRPVLNGIDTMLCSGNFYGILGPNGAGKSSLARQILRLDPKSGGDIGFFLDGSMVDTVNISRKRLAREIAFLRQSVEVGVNFTVYDVVSMGREPYMGKLASLTGTDRQKIDEAMEYTGCSHLRDRNIQLLSGGERQRVLIARTIAQDTPWIILDEPVSSLDVKHQYDLMTLLEKLREEKSKTIVAILHDLNLADTFCNKVILMKDGGIFAQGDTRQILTTENLGKVFDINFEFVNTGSKRGRYIAVSI